MPIEGILLIDKPAGCTAFALVSLLRRRTGVRTIGHAGTLDPLATGVMVMLLGRRFTRCAQQLLADDKQYRVRIRLGAATTTYDRCGEVVATSPHIPAPTAIAALLERFQGRIEQIPPMFSAKKVGGQKLYHLARQGRVVARRPISVTLETTLLSYCYPDLELEITCSKGTYIRSIAHDIGQALTTGAHVVELCRLRSGPFSLPQCCSVQQIRSEQFCIAEHLLLQVPERS